ncbi:MAG: hypothetical protein HQK56_16995 [Deltaproteobacteria bacterium]|nr:hypothetical protein [Deltaproteobacteria bacterium]
MSRIRRLLSKTMATFAGAPVLAALLLAGCAETTPYSPPPYQPPPVTATPAPAPQVNRNIVIITGISFSKYSTDCSNVVVKKTAQGVEIEFPDECTGKSVELTQDKGPSVPVSLQPGHVTVSAPAPAPTVEEGEPAKPEKPTPAPEPKRKKEKKPKKVTAPVEEEPTPTPAPTPRAAAPKFRSGEVVYLETLAIYKTVSSAVTQPVAEKSCRRQGLSLPTKDQLLKAAETGIITIDPSGEWAKQVNNQEAFVVRTSDHGIEAVVVDREKYQLPYRCVGGNR